MMRCQTCLEFLSHCVVKFAGSSLWSCAMPFGTRVWRVSVADKKRKFEPDATGTQCMRRDWKCDEDKSQRIPVLCECTEGMAYPFRRHAGLVSAPLWDSVTVVTRVFCSQWKSLHVFTHQDADTLMEGWWSQDGYHPVGYPGTFRFRFATCTGDPENLDGDYTTPTEHHGTFYQRNIHVEGWCVCSRRVFSCRTGLLVFYLSLRFSFLTQRCLVDMYALNLFGVRRHFSFPVHSHIVPVHPRSPILHHHLDRSIAFGFHQMFF